MWQMGYRILAGLSIDLTLGLNPLCRRVCIQLCANIDDIPTCVMLDLNVSLNIILYLFYLVCFASSYPRGRS